MTANILSDSVAGEGREALTLTLGPTGLVGATLGSTTTATVTIVDASAPPPTVTVKGPSSPAEVTELAGTNTTVNGAQFTVTLSGKAPAGGVQIPWRLTGGPTSTGVGTATAGTDFTAVSNASSGITLKDGVYTGILTIKEGRTAETVTANILSDSVLGEGREALTLTLGPTGLVGATLGTTKSATAVIVDTGTIRVAPSATTINEGQTLTTTVSATGVAAGTTLYWQVFQRQADGSRWDMKTLGVSLPGGDFSSGALEGSGRVGSDGRFTFAHTLSNDVSWIWDPGRPQQRTAEGDEQFEFVVYSDAERKTEVAASPLVTVKDTSRSILSFEFRNADWQGQPFRKLFNDGTSDVVRSYPQRVDGILRDGIVRFTTTFYETISKTTEQPWIPGRPTIVYAHGWKDSPGSTDPNSSSQLLFKALYERYGSTHNIALVDWQNLARNTNYPGPLGAQPIAEISVTKQVGETVGYALLQAGVEPSKLTLIGHSLGSYVMSAAAQYIKGATGNKIAELVGLDPAFGLGYDIDARNGIFGVAFGNLSQDPPIPFTTDIATKTRTYTASDLMDTGKMAGDNKIAATAERAYLVQYSKTDFEVGDTVDAIVAYHNAVIGVYADLVRKGLEDAVFDQQFDTYGKPNSTGPFDGVIVAAQPWITSPKVDFRVPKAIGWTDGFTGINIVGSPKSDVLYHDRFDKDSISGIGTRLIGGEGDDFLVAGDWSDNNGIDELYGEAGSDTFVFGYQRYNQFDRTPYRDKWDVNLLDYGEDSYAIIQDFELEKDRLQFAIAKGDLRYEAYGDGVRLRYSNGDLFAEIPNLSYDEATAFLNSSKTKYSATFNLDTGLFQNR